MAMSHIFKIQFGWDFVAGLTQNNMVKVSRNSALNEENIIKIHLLPKGTITPVILCEIFRQSPTHGHSRCNTLNYSLFASN